MSDILDEAIEGWDEWLEDCTKIHKMQVLYLEFIKSRNLQVEFLTFAREYDKEQP